MIYNIAYVVFSLLFVLIIILLCILLNCKGKKILRENFYGKHPIIIIIPIRDREKIYKHLLII